MKFFILILLSFNTFAQEVMKYEYKSIEGRKESIEAVIRTPKTDGKKKAVIILHHGGGWGEGTTTQYAEFFSQHGFVTLEPRMFNARPKLPGEYLDQVFGGLAYLSSHPEVDNENISVMGLSFGGMLTLYAGTEWANKRFGDGINKFKLLAPVYPVCWLFTKLIKREVNIIEKFIPNDFLDSWIGSPMKIFAGGMDDYDDKDPKACNEFVETIPDMRQKSVTTVQVYADATHGWDRSTTKSFNDRLACKGRGCINTNTSNPSVTVKGKEDLLKFLNEGK